jgi:hypothetical protein
MKQHLHSALRSALIAAGCIAGASAWAVTPGAASNDLATPKPSVSMQQGNNYGNATDKGADTNRVQPSREAVQRRANEPSTSVLDDNAQRQHDRDQGSTQRPSDDTAGTTHNGQSSDNAGMSSDKGTTSGAIVNDTGSSGTTTNDSGTSSTGPGMSSDSTSSSTMPGSASGTSGSDANAGTSTWNWDAIDANHDNSVSPEEMDNWLQKNRPQNGSVQPEASPQK